MTSTTVGPKTGLLNLEELNYPGSMSSVPAFPAAWDFERGKTHHSHLSQQDQSEQKPCCQFRKHGLELQKPFFHQAPEPPVTQRNRTPPFISACDHKYHFTFLSPFPTQHPTSYNYSFFSAINTVPSQTAETNFEKAHLKVFSICH